MPIDVRITFDGLYMLAPDEENGQVHAVLAKFGHASGGHHDGESGSSSHLGHTHHARLYFDAAHLMEDPDERMELTGHLFHESLEGHSLLLGSPTTGGRPQLELPDNILPISRVSAAKALDPKWVANGRHVGSKVAGRVTLASGNVRRLGPDSYFEVTDADVEVEKPVAATSRVEWVLQHDGNSLKLELKDLENGVPEEDSITLFPIPLPERDAEGNVDVRQVVMLHVYCATATALPGAQLGRRPQVGDLLPHLEGIFQFFGGRTPKLRRVKGPQGGTKVAAGALFTAHTEICTGTQIAVAPRGVSSPESLSAREPQAV